MPKIRSKHPHQVGVHLLVNGELAQVLERNTISGQMQVKVEYHVDRPDRSRISWINAKWGMAIP